MYNQSKPDSNEWTLAGRMTTSRAFFDLLEVVDGMYLLGGTHPETLDTIIANEVCTVVHTDKVECEIVGGKTELGLLGQTHS